MPTLLAWTTGNLGTALLDGPARLALLVPILLLQLLTSGLGEEPGWRGFLLPRLQDRFTPVRTVWLLGLAWAVWHYPLTAIYALSGVPADAPAAAGVITIAIALLSLTLGLIGLTYLYVWLFNRTHSIFLMIVFHALTNTLPFLLPPALGPWALVLDAFPWLVVLILWLLTRPNFLRPATARKALASLE